ncbi:MAG: hypothetical protein SGBAC_013052 [Bacillariaceae sp.]
MSSKQSDDEIKAEQRKVREMLRANVSDDEDSVPGAFHSLTNPRVSKRSAEQRRQVVSQYVIDGDASDDDDDCEVKQSFIGEKADGDSELSSDELKPSGTDSKIKDEVNLKRRGPRSLSPGATAVRGNSHTSQSKAEATKVTGSTALAKRQSLRRNSNENDDDDTTAVPPPGNPLRRAPVTYRDSNDPTNPPRQQEAKIAESDQGSEISAELVDEKKDQERLKETLENVVDVEAEDRLKRRRQRRNFCLYTLLAGAVLGGVVAAVVTTSNQKQLTFAPTISPSMSPTVAPTTRESAVVEAVVSEFGDLPEDEDAPQQKAIQWLTKEDTTTEFPIESEEAEHAFLERYVAAVFAYTTQYSSWINNDNWLNPDVSICDEWFGLSCNDDGRIGVLDLAVQNLDGPIPSEIGYLDNLDFVFLFRNKLRGTIPSEVGNLGDVDFMYLNENLLTGQVPDELSGLLDADELFLFGNQLTGTIPADFGGLVDLVNLYMHDNMLSGEIPSSLSQLKRLQRLYLQDNKIGGNIPSELGGIISLQRIQLQNNKLTGSIPRELGGFLGLSVLKLEGNELTGEMPEEVCALRDVGPIDDLEVLETDCTDPVLMVNCTCCSYCW